MTDYSWQVARAHSFDPCSSSFICLQIDIHNLKEGRLISNFIATFKLVPPPGKWQLCCRPTLHAAHCVPAACSSPAGFGSCQVCLRAACQPPAYAARSMALRCAGTCRCIAHLLRVLAATAGDSEETKIIFNSRIAAKSLPPPPFKGLVKGALLPVLYSALYVMSSSVCMH